MSEQNKDEAAEKATTDKPVRAPLSEEEKAARLKAAAERRAARATDEGAGENTAAVKSEAGENVAAVKSEAGTGATSTVKSEATSTVGAGDAGKSVAQAAEAGSGPACATDDAGAAKERPARPPRAKASDEPEKPKEPSPKQPLLDKLVALLKAEVAEDAVEESGINEINTHLPTVTIKNEHWLKSAELLRHHTEWEQHYLRNVSGVDQETHMEVIYHMINLSTKVEVAVRVKTDREAPSIASVAPIWPTADWNEREIFDLLGIDFPGHPDLRRIMMPDDWIGYPLRKDYEPLDSEV
ncbi:NADH-quinone oxidoreductase subunit C [Paenibacillus sp. 481]|uniref:NADH-quinone oxidoreductase subunit C n=1 Tax=Paenibacillus sp. 481 TaxID=2835869 RepID=UPI001E377E3A|nr:NADH-quinone oxidoreductase subunit C [Paenibacillus sp. 481]UHA75668.1 NADH-quinone oxidoreductase subunit C [Paenibacillus sp. 481]